MKQTVLYDMKQPLFISDHDKSSLAKRIICQDKNDQNNLTRLLIILENAKLAV